MSADDRTWREKRSDEDHETLVRLETEMKKIDELGDSIKTMNNWLRGTFGSLVLALVLLIIDLITHRRGL